MKQRDKATYSLWWFTGDETCGFCLQRHSHDVQYLCIACDRAVCPHCVTANERRESLCPQCFEELKELKE